MPEMNPQRAMVIGVLDGVHLGHQALLARAAQDGCRVLAAAFHPHPQSVLGQTTPLPLTTWRTRSRELRKHGARVIRLDPRSGLLETSAFDFIRDLHANHQFSRLVVGQDFRLGTVGREPRRSCRIWGLNWALRCTSLRMCKWKANGSPVPASGRLWPTLISIWPTHSWAARMRFWDAFEPAAARSPLGTPTANLHPQTMLPADGVYVTSSRLPGGGSCPRSASLAPTQHSVTRQENAKPMCSRIQKRCRTVRAGRCRWRFRLGFEERYDLTLQKPSSNKSTTIWKSHGNTMPIIGS